MEVGLGLEIVEWTEYRELSFMYWQLLLYFFENAIEKPTNQVTLIEEDWSK